MKRLVLVAVFALAAVAPAGAQGFESMGSTDYTTPTTTTETTPSYSSSTDRKFSLFASIGAGFSLGGICVGSSEDVVDRASGREITETDDEFANFGRGLKIDLGAAYKFLENVGVRAAFNMSFGVPGIEVTWKEKDEVLGTAEKMTVTMHNAQVGLKALLVPQFRAFDLFDVCVGAGLGLYWTSCSWEREDELPAGNYKEEVDVDCKATLPFIGMIGVEVPVADRLVLYGDLTYEAMNVTIEKVKVESTTFTVVAPYAGGWGEGDVGVGTRTTKYEKDAEDRAPTPKVPASNLAIRVGVRIPLF